MSDAAKYARTERRNNILSRYAQMAPGMQGAGAGAAMPETMDANSMGGPGISTLTTDPMAASMGEDGQDMDSISEPGKKKPFGVVCPSCGGTSTNVSGMNATCETCGTEYKIEMSLTIVSPGEKSEEEEGGMPGEEPEGPIGGPMGAPGAMTGGAPPAPAAPGAPAAGAPMPGMPAMANTKAMFRLAATVDADVYLESAQEGFNRTASRRMPFGMVCPSCGNRKANKVKDTTFCHDCGNISKTTVAANKNNPTKLDVTITWID